MTPRPSPFRADLLQGKVALVTGGATGLGLEIARVLGSHGARVAICSRKEPNLQAAVRALREEGIEAVYGVCDVRRDDEVTAIVEELLATFGRLDVVVNNAAGNFPVPISELTPNGFKAVVDIDLLGTFNVSKAAYDLWLRDHGGAVVNISAAIQYRGMALKRTSFRPRPALTRSAVPARSNGDRTTSGSMSLPPGRCRAPRESGESPATTSTAPSRIRWGVPARPPRSPRRCYSWPATSLRM